MDFEKVKRWYDGYTLGKEHVYNPNAVVNVMMRGNYQSYWSKTGTYESILPLINMNFDGLRTAIIQMLSGASVEVDTNTFQNDMVSFQNKDDVITLLIHLGYLAYDQIRRTAFIPNEEIRQEFLAATKNRKWDELIEFQRESKNLLDATLDMDCEAVPALLVELKWNKKAQAALQQIKDKKHVQAIAGYTGNILLVGISYDKKSKAHECIIEEYTI